jgi:hypothetical protein
VAMPLVPTTWEEDTAESCSKLTYAKV